MKSVHEGIKFFTLYHYITIKENLKKSRPQTKEILNLFRLNEHYTKTFQSRKIVQTEVLVECCSLKVQYCHTWSWSVWRVE